MIVFKHEQWNAWTTEDRSLRFYSYAVNWGKQASNRLDCHSMRLADTENPRPKED